MVRDTADAHQVSHRKTRPTIRDSVRYFADTATARGGCATFLVSESRVHDAVSQQSGRACCGEPIPPCPPEAACAAWLVVCLVHLESRPHSTGEAHKRRPRGKGPSQRPWCCTKALRCRRRWRGAHAIGWSLVREPMGVGVPGRKATSMPRQVAVAAAAEAAAAARQATKQEQQRRLEAVRLRRPANSTAGRGHPIQGATPKAVAGGLVAAPCAPGPPSRLEASRHAALAHALPA